MARELSQKSIVIRDYIKRHPQIGNTALAELINKNEANCGGVKMNDVANQRTAMGKKETQEGPPASVLGFPETETIIDDTATTTNPVKSTQATARTTTPTADVVINPMAAAQKNGAEKYQSTPLIEVMDEEIFDTLKLAKQFVKAVGGMEKAIRLLKSLEEFAK